MFVLTQMCTLRVGLNGTMSFESLLYHNIQTHVVFVEKGSSLKCIHITNHLLFLEHPTFVQEKEVLYDSSQTLTLRFIYSKVVLMTQNGYPTMHLLQVLSLGKSRLSPMLFLQCKWRSYQPTWMAFSLLSRDHCGQMEKSIPSQGIVIVVHGLEMLHVFQKTGFATS